METRIIIWNTLDTAPKDSYTSDVYVSCELLGAGNPKMTDTHKSVKVKAYGMFNYRLKWRCKYPDMNLEYLMRIGVWVPSPPPPPSLCSRATPPYPLPSQPGADSDAIAPRVRAAFCVQPADLAALAVHAYGRAHVGARAYVGGSTRVCRWEHARM